jgi:hypothetical protein
LGSREEETRGEERKRNWISLEPTLYLAQNKKTTKNQKKYGRSVPAKIAKDQFGRLSRRDTDVNVGLNFKSKLLHPTFSKANNSQARTQKPPPKKRKEEEREHSRAATPLP